jgi:hypothetical protein
MIIPYREAPPCGRGASQLSQVRNPEIMRNIHTIMIQWVKKIAVLKREEGIDRLRGAYGTPHN